jgi:uncharacterized protein YcfJ
MKMPFIAVVAALMTAMPMTATTANAGCVTGAVVGGVVGHFAGHHALVGAGAGCVIGHEMKKSKERRYYRHHHH